MPARRKRKTRQAPEGEEEETELAQYEHGEAAADAVAEDLQAGIREMVLYALDPEIANRVSWSTANFPTLASLASLAGDDLFSRLPIERQRELLEDQSQQTPVERGDGLMPAVRVKHAAGRLASVAQLSAIFEECVGPAELEASTRTNYHASWRLVVTWGIAHECVAGVLPMTKDTLKALTLELLMAGCASGTIGSVWSSIEERHRRFGHPLPLGEPGAFRRLYKAVSAVKGAPSRVIFPIGSHHMKRMMGLLGLSSAQERDVLMCCTGTALNCRVGEVTFFRICDFLWDHDAPYHEKYLGTAAVRIYQRKKDTGRKGHLPRLGRASNVEWDLVLRLRRYAEQHNLEVSAECIKGENPGAGCRHCPPFFFKEPSGERRQTQKREPVSRQMVTDAVIRSLQLVGTDTTYFSGSSMRRGGISAALTAKVPAPVLYLQSGHGGKMAAQNYMIPADPSVWYENFAALQL